VIVTRTPAVMADGVRTLGTATGGPSAIGSLRSISTITRLQKNAATAEAITPTTPLHHRPEHRELAHETGQSAKYASRGTFETRGHLTLAEVRFLYCNPS